MTGISLKITKVTLLISDKNGTVSILKLGEDLTLESLLANKKFWEIIDFIDLIKDEVDLAELFRNIRISKRDFTTTITLLEGLNFKVKIKNGKKLLLPPPLEERAPIDFSTSEWLLLEIYFSVKNFTLDGTLERKIEELHQRIGQSKQKERSLNSFIKQWEGKKQLCSDSYTGKQGELIQQIEEIQKETSLIECTLQDQSKLSLYIHRLVYIDAKISIVGESVNDNCLMHKYLENVQSLNKINSVNYLPNYSCQEVNDFITEIRALGENEERLVLKIAGGEDVDITPNKYHYLGRPCVITNKRGERIWAATVEFNDDLYEWLLEIKNYVEIIDPTSVKVKFLKYCEEKLLEEQKK